MFPLLDGTITTKLAFTVLPIDAFTGCELFAHDASVIIEPLGVDAVKNRSGHNNFLDLKNGTYRVRASLKNYSDYIEDITVPRVALSWPFSASAGATQAYLPGATQLRECEMLLFDNGTDLAEQRMAFFDKATGSLDWSMDLRGKLEKDYTASGSTVAIPRQEEKVFRALLKPAPEYHFPSGTTLIRGSVRTLEDRAVANAEVEVVGGIQRTLTAKNGGFVLYFPASYLGGQISVNITPLSGTPTVRTIDAVRGQTVSMSVVIN